MYLRHSNVLGRTPPFLPWKSSLKISILRAFLSLRKTLVATFNETGAPISRRYVVKQGVIIRNVSETLQYSWSHSSVFALEK